MFKWFKKKVPEVSKLTHAQQLELKLIEASKVENLVWVKSLFQGLPIDNGDLTFKPCSHYINKIYRSEYQILYKNRSIGVIILDKDNPPDSKHLNNLVKAAMAFSPELFPVRINEFYNLRTYNYLPIIDQRIEHSILVQVIEIYLDLETQLPIYLVKTVTTGELKTYSHTDFSQIVTRIQKVA